MSYKKLLVLFALVFAAALALAACQPAEAPEPEVVTVVETVIMTQEVEVEGETVVETVIVTVEAEPEEEGEAAGATGECCDAYRIALFEDPVSLNYWNYLGPGSSVWTSYVVAGQNPSLFTLSDVRFDWVPSLATGIPEIVDNGDGTFTITVEMVQDAVWSDGNPITANDVVFTHNACKDLQLTQNWPNSCKPNDADIQAVALDDFTVEYTFLDQAPSLATWQAGISLAPIMSEAFWGDEVANAYTFIEGVEAPPEDDDCSVEEPSEACNTYMEAYENARLTLYEGDATGAPTAGGYSTDQWEPGAFVQRTANDGYYFRT